VSSLWTPEGERPVGRPTAPDPGAPPPSGGDGGGPGPDPGADAEAAAQLEALRRQILSVPADVVVANHAYGLFELAAIHLSEQPARLEEAALAVDALGALVEGLSGRLGEAEESLRQALSQIRLAFVQIRGAATAGDGEPTA
jgi:hypothetical protein